MFDEINKILTPVSLWEDFSCNTSLKENKINEIVLNNLSICDYYFSGEESGNSRVRIYSAITSPTNKTNKAILLVGDVKDGINHDFINYFAKFGYVVMSIDLAGKEDKKDNFTDYTDNFAYANYFLAKDNLTSVPKTAKETCWYHWLTAERYAITFLQKIYKIEKICAVGIKSGADIVWQLSAIDKRIDCACMLFGNGWLSYKGAHKFIDNEIEMSENSYKFLAGLEPHSYAQFVECPVLYLTSTNNEYYDCDRAYDTLSRMDKNQNKFFNFSPKYNEYLDERSEKDLLLFLNKYLGDNQNIIFYNEPKIDLELVNNVAKIRISEVEIEEVESISVYASEGVGKSNLRCWINCVNKGDYYSYHLNGNSNIIFAFATITYKNGVTLSTKILSKKYDEVVSRFGNLIYSSLNGLNNINFIDNNIEKNKLFLDSTSYLKLVKCANQIEGVYSPTGLINYSFAQSSFKLNDEKILKIDVFCTEYLNLKIALYTEDSQEKFEATIELNSSKMWQTKSVKLSDFKNSIGLGIVDFTKVYAFTITTDGKYAINNIILI